jgi:hypothetical protein
MPGFDMVKYLKSKMSTQAPQPNRPRSNAVTAAPMTFAQRGAVSKQESRMKVTTTEILNLEEVLKLAIDKPVTRSTQEAQFVRGAMLQLWKVTLVLCADLRSRIWREVNSTPRDNMTVAKMTFREEMMQNVIRQIYGMANAMNTAANELETVDRHQRVKLIERCTGDGYFDAKLLYALGLVQASKFAEPFGH